MLRAVFAFLLLMLLPSGVQAQKRVALLIGNQGYNERVGPLRNPHRDVALVGKALADIGFASAKVVRDGSRDEMLEAVYELGSRLRSAGTGAVGFLYYTGHGVAVDRENVLIPANVADTSDRTLSVRGVKLGDVLDILNREAPDAVHFVVLDACRNNMRGSRGGKGFAQVGDRKGFVIAFATAAGDTASDEGTDSGPYAAALAEELVRPGRNDQQVFNAVRTRVVALTRTQTPWTHDGLIGERIVFRDRAAVASPPPAPVVVAPPPPPPVQTGSIEAERAWDRVKDVTNIAVLEAYVLHYKGTFYADLARARIAELSEKAKPPAPPKAAEAPKPAAEAPKAVAPPAPKPEPPAKVAALPKEKKPVENVRQFDGTWTMSYKTGKGCDIPWSGSQVFTINNGRISLPNGGGRVTGGGFASGNWVAPITGTPLRYSARLRGDGGSGTYKTEKDCHGTFTVTRH